PLGAVLEKHTLLAVAVDPASPSRLYAAAGEGGVLRSGDGGEHWIEAATALEGRHIGAVSADPRGGGVGYAGAEGGPLCPGRDAAASWEELPTPARVAVSVIAFDPAGERIFVGTNSEGVFWSDDGGKNWRRPSGTMSRGTVWTLTFDRVSGALFAG